MTANPLHEALAALGATAEEIAAAERDGTVLGLAADRYLVPGAREFSVGELADESGTTAELVTRLMLAMGFPPRPGEKAFTQYDIDIIRLLFRDDAQFTDYALHEARVISAALARVAEVFVDEMWDQHFADGQSEVEALKQLAPTLDFDRVERMLLYLLRRHLVASIYRRLGLHDQAKRHGAPSLAIGFADLADFSTLSRDMSDTELTKLIVSFEQAAYDIAATHGGRVIKTLGDGVMFASDTPEAAAGIALRLAGIDTAGLPPVRVGLGFGPVLIREGDCFGPTVNLVSRIVDCADGGHVVVDREIAHRLHGNGYSLSKLGERELKSFGAVELWNLGGQAPPETE